ncbi:DNA polymerase kappa [Micractinium conductrix]|uniref:DNA polymerase kappa n=1 Tax=Micractinium conductrix TaxID=554055 RepID=A0A2P6VCH6_9CHLO|nr:DNA polymerase kappa [Micractinium conductrix]|eukprot:PSC71787.1 DNA polymerase kappa [Micractinium conductrix]
MNSGRPSPGSKLYPRSSPGAGGSSARRLQQEKDRIAAMMLRVAAAAAAMSALVLVLLLSSASAASQLEEAAEEAAATLGRAGAAGRRHAALNAAGKPLLTPMAITISGHEALFEVPQRPRHMLILLHKCGRSAGDHWPRSQACPDCAGLPQEVSKTKQALARGYVVVAISSADREQGGGRRCFKLADDGEAVARAVAELPAKFKLKEGYKVFIDGASSGGSLALRMPQDGLAKFDGIIAEVIAPTGMAALLPRMRDFPPAVYIHAPRDTSMEDKVQENLAALRAANLTVADVELRPLPLSATFFSDRSPSVSRRLSELVYKKIKGLGLLDGRGYIAEGADPGTQGEAWGKVRAYLSEDLRPQLPKMKGQRERSVPLLLTHVFQQVSLAWARHETVGDYMTAALLWLEAGGQGDLQALADKHRDISLLVTVPRLPVWAAEVTPDPLEDALRLAASVRVSLRDAWVRAGVRVTLRPLLRRLPVVGAVQVGLTRVPEFGYELALSKASAALVPLIREWLDGAVRDMVLQPWVLPDHAVFPLEPGAPDLERPAGILAVRVLGAEHVPRPGLLSGAPRPMLELFLRDAQRRQTAAAPAGAATDWGRPCFELPVSLPEHQQLSVILYHYADFSPNDELGRASLPLRDLRPGEQQTVELLLRAHAEEVHEEQQERMSWGDRAAMALARPFTKKGGDTCRLRLQVTYLPLSEAQAAAVMQQQGLPVPERGGAGALPPLALRLLRSGLLVVAVPCAKGVMAGLGASASLFKPFFKVLARVAGQQAETDSARANRSGVVEFSRPLAMHLEQGVLDAAEDGAVELELVAHTWMQGVHSCGRLHLPLAQLVRGDRIEGWRTLEGGGSGHGCIKLVAQFKPFF